MSGCERLCLITNRHLTEDLPGRVERALQSGLGRVMLREKELSHSALLPLARELAALCRAYDAELVINSDVEAAQQVKAQGVQLPFALFSRLWKGGGLGTLAVGVSVHSLEEAKDAREMGADWVLYGNIFETGCKPGLPGRGLETLARMAAGLNIPVWAVGGILPENVGGVLKAGAQVACVMSTLLQAQDVADVLQAYRAGYRQQV